MHGYLNLNFQPPKLTNIVNKYEKARNNSRSKSKNKARKSKSPTRSNTRRSKSPHSKRTSRYNQSRSNSPSIKHPSPNERFKSIRSNTINMGYTTTGKDQIQKRVLTVKTPNQKQLRKTMIRF